MTMTHGAFLDVGGQRLHSIALGPPPDEAPTLVLLHEGLGSAELWGDFPDRLQEATGAGIVAYSRAGYGHSSPAKLPRTPRYMHEEALDILPRVLDAIGFRRGLIIGHSDGASIATIYAGSVEDHRIRGLVLIAPHFFVEDISIASIAQARTAYESGDLKARLARWHDDVDHAFRGWNDIWLDPAFRNWDITEPLAFVRVPIQIVQGIDDQYGTVRQIEAAQEECYCPVEVAMIAGARHVPHREKADATLARVADFANRLLRDHGEAKYGTPGGA